MTWHWFFLIVAHISRISTCLRLRFIDFDFECNSNRVYACFDYSPHTYPVDCLTGSNTKSQMHSKFSMWKWLKRGQRQPNSRRMMKTENRLALFHRLFHIWMTELFEEGWNGAFHRCFSTFLRLTNRMILSPTKVFISLKFSYEFRFNFRF